MIGLSLEIRHGSGTATTTIDFNAGGYKLLDGFYPQTGRDGEPVTDAFDVMIHGSSDSDLGSKVRAVESALDFAAQHPNGPDGVWILFTPKNGVLTATQARLSGGALLHNEKLNSRWKNLAVKAQVVIERAPYWEDEDLTTLQVTNRAGTGATGAVVNHQDAGATDDFYIEIAADQVTGTMETPAVISYKNTVNDAALVDEIRVGHFVASGTNEPPAASALILEGTGSADAACSGGAYASLSWTGTGENSLATWTLASGAFRQRNYKAVARLQAATAYTDLFLKAKLMSGTLVLAETRWTLVSAGPSLVEIGSMQIPPFRFGAHVDLGNLTVALYEKRAGSDGAITLDYVALMPQDSWRKLEAVAGSGLAYNETLTDDPTLNTLATLAGAAYKVTQVVAEGEPVMLQPGVKNVLYFLASDTTGAAPIARTATVTVQARMRKRSI